MSENSRLEEERREERRIRRHKNQIGAYVALLVMIAIMATGIVIGIKYITEMSRNKNQNIENYQNNIDELLNMEESFTAPEPTETIPEMTPLQKLDEIVNAGIEVMPLEDKIAGLFMVTPEAITGVSTALQAGEGTQTALAKYAVGGIIYFSKNIESKEQLAEMIDNTKLYTKYPLFIGIDEEGGSVARVAQSGIADPTDSAQVIGQSADVNNAYLAGSTIGTYLAELGFNLDFAPVADLANVEDSIMTGRAYGAEASVVAPFVTSMMQGLEEQKVTACMKHFPGIGSTSQDTHNGLATTDRSAEDFRANEFAVFKAGIDAGANMIMVGHMAAPSLSGEVNTPSTMSKNVVTDILRQELGFNGVIITDAMNMSAISEYYGSDEAAVMALKAGCDMILMPEDFEVAYSGVLQAVQNGVISEERINDSLRRIYRIKYAGKME